MDTNWIEITAGEFMMGAQKENPEERNYDTEAGADESLVHSVFLNDYWIGRYPVMVAEYLRFVEDGGYEKKAFWKEGGFEKWTEPGSWRERQVANPARPVVEVSWYEATAYAAWAGCRLPTEAEWERAACGTMGRKYPWGSDHPKVGRSASVDSYPLGATPEGRLDRTGNVWEWCHDVYDKEYYGKSPKKNPKGPARIVGAGGLKHVLRGGSWVSSCECRRSAFRGSSHPEFRSDDFGFRVVCVLSPETSH